MREYLKFSLKTILLATDLSPCILRGSRLRQAISEAVFRQDIVGACDRRRATHGAGESAAWVTQ